MLDLYKLIPQIDLLGKENSAERDKATLTAQEALRLFLSLENMEDETLARLKSNQGLPLWPVSIPLEPFAEIHPLKALKEEMTVIGVDGSQIMPSQHEIMHCYLLNIGLVQINYGSKDKPILTNTPYLFHKREQLYPLMDRRRLRVDELYVALERHLLELEILSQQAVLAQSSSQKILSLMDGSLLPWSLDQLPLAYQNQYLLRMTKIFEIFKSRRLPLFGYISNSRSAEIVNSMRILICPYNESNCNENCRDLNEDDFPCSRISPLTDRHLFSLILPVLSRSTVFLSGSRLGQLFNPYLKTCLFYCNFGGEIARLECPRWLVEDKEIFDIALSSLTAQVDRGDGYPVVLAEAHHQAVIKNADREQFFALLARHLVSLGEGLLQPSAKAAKKRLSAI